MSAMADVSLLERSGSLSAAVAEASLSNDEWVSATMAGIEAPSAVVPEPVRLLSLGDAGYPAMLRSVEFAPQHLCVIGNLSVSTRCPVAVVGSRSPSDEGVRAAFDTAATLARRGHSIVSGLASGIDAAAHRGALSAGGHTVAVVGTGADCVFPAENRELRDMIAARGAIVSQFPLGHGPSKTTFPARNAVIAGLSAASVVIESTDQSGTRIEAELTLEQDKPVLLWAPILADEPWAQEFARRPLVCFVDSVSNIAAALDRCAR